MPENGRTKDIGERLLNAGQRFAAMLIPPKPEPIPERAPEPTHEEKIASVLGEWADGAPKEFWRELDRWLRTAHLNARANVKDHGETAYGLGFEAAIEQVRDKFTSWRTTGNPADSQGD